MADLTPDRLQELRRIAEAATPGPWIKDADKRYSVRSHWNPPRDGNVVGWRVCVVSGNGPQSDADWDYITEFNPKTTLALLDRIEALEAMLLRLYQDTVVPNTHYCHRCGVIGGHDELCAMAEVEKLLGIEVASDGEEEGGASDA